jgi:hypothetical protein
MSEELDLQQLSESIESNIKNSVKFSDQLKHRLTEDAKNAVRVIEQYAVGLNVIIKEYAKVLQLIADTKKVNL